jgi:hypothetical protein
LREHVDNNPAAYFVAAVIAARQAATVDPVRFGYA